MSKQKQKRPAFSGFSKLAVIIGGLFAVCAAGMGYYVYRQKTAAPAIETIKAERRDLKEQVSVTGTVEPVERADLSFDLSGRVDLVLVEIGQTVKAGDGLIKLESADLAAEYAQAQAKVKAEEARLAQLQAAVMVQESLYKELQRGATNEETELARLKVANAEKELADALIQQQNVLIETNTEVENAYQTSKTLLSEASTVFDRILFARTQSMFTTGIGEKNLVFTTSDHQIETAARTQRAQSELRLAQLKSSLSTALSHEQIDELSQKTLEDSLYIRDFLFTLNAALKGELDLSDTLKATFSSDVDQSLADIALIQNKLNSQSQTLSSAKLASNNKTDAVQATVNTAQNVVLLAKQE